MSPFVSEVNTILHTVCYYYMIIYDLLNIMLHVPYEFLFCYDYIMPISASYALFASESQVTMVIISVCVYSSRIEWYTPNANFTLITMFSVASCALYLILP
jgi:hypothetical protein